MQETLENQSLPQNTEAATPDTAPEERPAAYEPDPREAAIRAHFDSLCRQAEELRKDYPDFDLSAALRDPDFVRLTAPATNLELRKAFYALNRDSLEAAAERRGAESARAALSKSLAAGAFRPRESSAHSAAAFKADYRNMTSEGREELKKRIRDAGARGEKIFP